MPAATSSSPYRSWLKSPAAPPPIHQDHQSEQHDHQSDTDIPGPPTAKPPPACCRPDVSRFWVYVIGEGYTVKGRADLVLQAPDYLSVEAGPEQDQAAPGGSRSAKTTASHRSKNPFTLRA